MTEVTEERVYQIDCNEIIVKTRQRVKKKKQTIPDLAKSINVVGQIQPGVCCLNKEGKPVLLVGERRLLACKLLRIPYTYILKEEITDPLILKQIELEENLCREELHWLDEINAKAELHELYQTRFGLTTQGARGGHKLSDTAERFGESTGLISADIELAMWAKEIPEVAEAENKTEAKKIVKRLKLGVRRRVALDKALGVLPPREEEEEKEAEDTEGSDYSYEVSKEDATVIKTEKLEISQEVLLEYDRRCLLGEMEFHLGQDLRPEPFDIVPFDPPWGVEFDKVMATTGSQQKYPDKVKVYKAELLKQLQLIYNTMSEHSHLYMFFGIVHHKFVYDTLEEVGFNTNRMPILWHKLGAHRTRNPEIWPGRCYEPIAYARKGKKPLFLQGRADIIQTPPPSPAIKQDHPSAKHPDIYIELLKRSASPGDRVLDPMAGSGMVGVACEHLREQLALDWTMIEKEETFRDLQLMNLVRGYENIITVKYTAPTDFRELNPGSTEWLNFWKDHPEQQEAMMAWVKEGEEEER